MLSPLHRGAKDPGLEGPSHRSGGNVVGTISPAASLVFTLDNPVPVRRTHRICLLKSVGDHGTCFEVEALNNLVQPHPGQNGGKRKARLARRRGWSRIGTTSLWRWRQSGFNPGIRLGVEATVLELLNSLPRLWVRLPKMEKHRKVEEGKTSKVLGP